MVVCGWRKIEKCLLNKIAIILGSPRVGVRVAGVTLVDAFDNCGERERGGEGMSTKRQSYGKYDKISLSLRCALVVTGPNPTFP